MQEAEIVYERKQCFEWSDKAVALKKTKAFIHKNIVIDKTKQLESFAENLESILEQNDSDRVVALSNFRIKDQIEKGNAFLPFEVEDLNSDKKIQLKIQENEVLIVIFWSMLKEDCPPEENIKPMDFIEKMLAHDKKWKNLVRVVGVNIDDKKNEVVDHIKQKKWTKVTHYFLGKNKKAMSFYGVQVQHLHLPQVVLMDKYAEIQMIGHPYEIRLDDEINKYYDEKYKYSEKEESKKNELLKLFPNENAKIIKTLLKDPKFASHLTSIELKYKPKFLFDMKREIVFNEEMKIQEMKHQILQFVLSLRKSDLNPIFSKIYELIPNKELYQIEISETVNLKFGSQCEACKKQIKAFDPQYYCHFCKLWFCEKCGDKVDQKKTGNDRLIHPHNMVWINVSDEKGLKDDIDEHKFGKNITHKENCQNHEVICSACYDTLKTGYRYICLNCGPGPKGVCLTDLCEKCMVVLREKKSKRMEVVKNLGEKHDVKSHLWFRVCYGNSDILY